MQSIAMTSKEILQADLLDILFENRNKAYGAYALRKTYNHRLQFALGISLFLMLLIVMTSLGKQDLSGSTDKVIPGLVVRTIDIPDTKPPGKPRFRKPPEALQVRDTRVEIVSDDRVPKPEVPTTNELQPALISTINKPGIPLDSVRGLPTSTADTATNKSKQHTPREDVLPVSSDAQFPGGKEAFGRFLSKYLITPGNLEPGEKKIVLVRFMVDGDGNISKTDIVQSDGDEYSKEVLRVLKKMPKWIPAMQNGNKVATWFTQPVTFIGIEQ
jgi:protein TonB